MTAEPITAPLAPGEPTTARWRLAWRLDWAQRRSRIRRACRAVSRRVWAEIMRDNLAPGEAHTFGAE